MSRKRRKINKQVSHKLKLRFTDQITDIFKSNPNRNFNYKQISSFLDVTDQPTRKIVSQVLDYMVKQETLELNDRGKYRYKGLSGSEIVGVTEFTKRGGAFIVSPDLEKDVFVTPQNLHNSLDGDTVRIKLVRGRKGKMEGEVVEVIDQDKREFVGTLRVSPKYAVFKPDNHRIGVDMKVPLDQMNGAEQGQKVIVKITEWPDNAHRPLAKVTDVLGTPGETDTEMHAILAEFGLPRAFPDGVEAAADKIPLEISKEEIAKRRDYREITTFTIDPLTAQDFDDALSLQKLENGNWEVGVHIADVSHYVKEGDKIDEEALKRATSVYLVDRVVPMLPEVLSNKVCSLRPNEEKCVFSAIFELDDKANVKNEWFGRCVINSDRRFTYEEAQERIETGKGDFAEEINTLDRLAKILRKRRVQSGSIEFGSTEVRFELDENKKPIRVYEKVMQDANRLIEDFMLLANRKVAAFVGKVESKDKKEKAKTFVYRVHDLPDPEKLETLSRFLRNFGYKINFASDPSESLNRLLRDFKDRPERKMVEQIAIRSMAKAVYTTKNIGHYGLGFEYYSHFTSPIRRYPDLLAHRLLEHYLDGGASKKAEPLEAMCKHSSIMEKKAADAERASIKYMQIEFMMDRIGETFEGIVTGVTEWGMYVELIETRCEGMVSLRSIPYDDYWFEESKYRIVGRRSGNTYTLGDQVTVTVKSADLEKKQLDLELEVGH